LKHLDSDQGVAGCRSNAEAYPSKMTNADPARHVQSTGFAVLDRVFQASPMSRRAIYVGVLTLLGSIEAGVILSGQALLIETALALTFFAFVFGLASVARHSKTISLLVPWLLWPMSLVVVAVTLTLTCSLYLGWPLRFPVLG
jgi:hypothetical protein